MHQDISEFAIDTWMIYDDLSNNCKKVPRQIIKDVEEALEFILSKEKIVTVAWDCDREYFESRLKRLDARLDKIEDNPNISAISHYFIGQFSEGYF